MHTVLAIDDSPDIHLILAARLKHEELVLEGALTAQEGMEKAQQLRPDLILLDLDLPDATGFDLCERLKAEPATAQIPIIFLTATSTVGVKVQGLELGAVDFVTKPFEPAELRARVRGALRIKRSHDLLFAHAHIDAMTGLWNRRSFDQRLTEELSAAIRYGRSVTLALVDLDHFKRLNDDHGHSFGDRVLEEVGRVLAATARTADAACRFGGEEFAVIMTGTSSDGGYLAAQRVREAIAGLRLRHGDEVVPLTASIGVAGTDQMAHITGKMLIELADAALYAAKRAGRDQVSLFPRPAGDSKFTAACPA